MDEGMEGDRGKVKGNWGIICLRGAAHTLTLTHYAWGHVVYQTKIINELGKALYWLIKDFIFYLYILRENKDSFVEKKKKTE